MPQSTQPLVILYSQIVGFKKLKKGFPGPVIVGLFSNASKGRI